jgi:hypothetical protein
MAHELVGNQAAADYVGVSVNTWRPYVARGQAPEPADRIHRSGHSVPVWTKRQLDEWMRDRPGVGAPGRPRAKRKAAA